MRLEQYYQSYYSNKTQSIIKKLPTEYINMIAEKFNEWWTEIERERFKKGLRKFPLPTDQGTHFGEYYNSNYKYHSNKDYRIVTILNQYKSLTAKEIAKLLKEPAISVRSKLYHAVKRGEVIKLIPPSKNKQRYNHTIYALPETFTQENTHELQSQ